MSKATKLYLYTVKYFDSKGWHYLQSEYLNPFDSNKEKMKNIDEIKRKNRLSDGYCINISNFNNVYC